jgi:uncharacterized protein (DUF1015 family)
MLFEQTREVASDECGPHGCWCQNDIDRMRHAGEHQETVDAASAGTLDIGVQSIADNDRSRSPGTQNPLAMHRKLGFPGNNRVLSGSGSNGGDESAVPGCWTSRCRKRRVGIRSHPPGAVVDGVRRLCKIAPANIGTISLCHGSRVFISSKYWLQSLFNQRVLETLSADKEHASAAWESFGQESRSRLCRGDHLAGLCWNAQLCELGGDLVGCARCIVRDEGQPHTGGTGLTQGIPRTGYGVVADVHHAVEIQQRDVVVLHERGLACLQTESRYHESLPRRPRRRPYDSPVTARSSLQTDRLRLRSFRALRYAPAHVPDLGAVTSPPYDVVGEQGVLRYEQASPVNVVRLILPRPSEASGHDGSSDRYVHAAHDLRCWVEAGVLIEDAEPSVWVYEQRGGTASWRGVLGAVSVHDPHSRAVVPHEDVFPGPVRDRAALMEATSAQLEPIMLVHNGAESLGRLLRALPMTVPDIAVTTDDDVEHVLWRISDVTHLAELDRVASSGYALIADGHHRYAAYQLQRQRHVTDRDSGWNFGFAWLVDAVTDPLSLSAIHRTLGGVSLERFAAAVSPYASCTAVAGHVDDWLAQLDTAQQPGFVVTDGVHGVRVGAPEPGWLATMLVDRDESLRHLDSVVLHDALLTAALAIKPDDPRMGYEHNAVTAVEWARGSDGLAILMRPPALDDVLAAANAGIRMPRKSTSFGPKPRNGLILRKVASVPS